MKTVYIKSINGCTDFKEQKVEMYEKIEHIIDYELHHSWYSTQKGTNHLGSDYIKFKRTEHSKFYKNGRRVRYERMYTYYHSTIFVKKINQNGGRFTFDVDIEDVSWSRVLNTSDHQLHYLDKGTLTTIKEISKLDPVISSYILLTLDFKRKHNGGSPLQQQAYNNIRHNADVDSFTDVASGLATIIGFIKHPYATYASAAISTGASIANKYLKKSEYAGIFELNYAFKSITYNELKVYLNP
ncbi:hypothetical protein PG637_02290 [Riemerella anatipestifer]|nr:hypothetical protein [Riemerella anatipestifer]MDY3324500.1 hypothetical protein [Riemerella anatipestifer]MDY3353311.1 hypothetical protein [Riemerella anatipestifer]